MSDRAAGREMLRLVTEHTDEESEAVALYLGWKITPYPRPDPTRLAERFGRQRGSELAVFSEGVLDELYSTTPDWLSEDLAGATDRAVASVIAPHPDLSKEAAAALRWSFSWDWK